MIGGRTLDLSACPGPLLPLGFHRIILSEYINPKNVVCLAFNVHQNCHLIQIVCIHPKKALD